MTAPEFQPAIVDGHPVTVMNAAALAEAVRQSPLAVEAATKALRRSMRPEHFQLVERELARH